FYIAESGTSVAAPHVAGVVALMFQKNPGLSFDEVRNHLHLSARTDVVNPSSTPLPNNEWGYGRVNAEDAVKRVPPPAPGVGGGGGGSRPRPLRLVPAGPARELGWRPYGRFRRSLRDGLARLGDAPETRLLVALASAHFDEVLRRINTDRRVAMLWHRMGGPD